MLEPLVDLVETLVDLLEPLVDLVETLVDLLETLVDLLETLVHPGTQRPQLGHHEGHLFAARERLHECPEDRRLQVRAAFQQLRQATAEQVDQVLVAERRYRFPTPTHGLTTTTSQTT